MAERDEAPADRVEQEAHRLVEAASEWLRVREWPPGAGAASGPGPQGPEAEDAAAGAGVEAEPEGHATCQGCPWCRARASVGPVGVDALDGLADLLTSAADSLRAFASTRRRPEPPPGPAGAGPSPTQPSPAEPGRDQKEGP